MTKEAVYVALNQLFSDIFDEEITLFPETTAKDIEGWDSLEHINVIHSVERRFGMKFKMGEISTMKCVGEMVDLILARATKE